MARTIITHVGTSLLNCGALHQGMGEIPFNNLGKRASLGRIEPSDIAACQVGLEKGLAHFWGNKAHSDQNRREAAPSEIASLSLLDVQATDRVVLLHSDTDAGWFCAKVLEGALSLKLPHSYPTCTAHPVEVKGLTVAEEGGIAGAGMADAFVRDGLKNYVSAICDEYLELRKQPRDKQHHCIFNVTGGYKGMIPTARDMTLLLTTAARDDSDFAIFRMCYLFQGSDHPIWFDSLPVRFDRNLPMEKLREAGEATGTVDAGVLASHRILFEETFKGSGRLKRSALGTVLFELRSKIPA